MSQFDEEKIMKIIKKLSFLYIEKEMIEKRLKKAQEEILEIIVLYDKTK